jgi:tellurite resistance protein
VAHPNPATTSDATPLAHFGFAWFVPVMGWIGLTMAWFQPPREASGISMAAQLSTLVTVTLFALVFLTQLIRAWRHPQALLADLRHPVRMAFTASFAIALVLMGTLGTLWGLADESWVQAIWWAGSLLEFSITVWVMSRCLRPADAGGLGWPAITPLLVIPIVGNVLVPLAGLHWPVSGWVSAQFGLGLFLWPLIVALLLVRLLQAGPLPARMTPTLFILVAPPSAIGLVLLQWQASSLLAWSCWAVGLEPVARDSGSVLWHVALGHELSAGGIFGPVPAPGAAPRRRVAAAAGSDGLVDHHCGDLVAERQKPARPARWSVTPTRGVKSPKIDTLQF